MALKFEVDSLDSVPEEHRALYQEVDGKFRLTVDGLPEQEDTSGLKLALNRERQRGKSAEKYEKLGLTPEQVKELIDAEEQRAQQKLKDEGDFKTLLAQHQEKWDGERTAIEGERDEARNALRSYAGESAFISELAKQGATEEGIAALPSLFVSRINVSIEGGSANLEIMQSDGKTPLAGTSDNGTATLTDLVKEASEKFPSLFKSEQKGGGGKPPDTAGGTPAKKWSEMSSGEKVRLHRENPKEYERIKVAG